VEQAAGEAGVGQAESGWLGRLTAIRRAAAAGTAGDLANWLFIPEVNLPIFIGKLLETLLRPYRIFSVRFLDWTSPSNGSTKSTNRSRHDSTSA
jgi:hypothetical protein